MNFQATSNLVDLLIERSRGTATCNSKLLITINVPVVYMAPDVMILMWATSITRASKRGGQIETFLGPEIAARFSGPTPSSGASNGFARVEIIKSKCHIKNIYISNFMCMSFCILRSVVCVLCSVSINASEPDAKWSKIKRTQILNVLRTKWGRNWVRDKSFFFPPHSFKGFLKLTFLFLSKFAGVRFFD